MVKTDLGDLKTRKRTGTIYDQKSIFRLNLLIVFSVCCFGVCCLCNIDDSEHFVSLLPTYGVMNFLCTVSDSEDLFVIYDHIDVTRMYCGYQVKKKWKKIETSKANGLKFQHNCENNLLSSVCSSNFRPHCILVKSTSAIVFAAVNSVLHIY